jgi:hypothetical protein
MSKRSNDVSKITINNINNIINNKQGKVRKYADLHSDDEELQDEQVGDDNEFDIQINTKNRKIGIPFKDLRTERLQYKKNKEMNFLSQDHLEFAKSVVNEQEKPKDNDNKDNSKDSKDNQAPRLKIVSNTSFEISSLWFEKDTIKYLDLIPDSSYEVLQNDEGLFHIEVKVTKGSEIMHFQLRLDKNETEYVEYIPVEVTFKWKADMEVLNDEIELRTQTIKYFFSAIMEYKYK